jgi:hypothetical protein
VPADDLAHVRAHDAVDLRLRLSHARREGAQEDERVRDAPDHVVVHHDPLLVAGRDLGRLHVEVEVPRIEGPDVLEQRQPQAEAGGGGRVARVPEEQDHLLLALAGHHHGPEALLAQEDQPHE